MASSAHSLGPTCEYYEPDPDSPLTGESGPPKVRAQFFYVSSLPIDDPLSPLPPISDKPATRRPQQPFSPRDNAALEEAWQGFQKGEEPVKDAKPGKLRANPLREIFSSFPKFKSTKSSGPLSPAVEAPKHEFNVDTSEMAAANSLLEAPYQRLAKPPPDEVFTKSSSKGAEDVASARAPLKSAMDTNKAPSKGSETSPPAAAQIKSTRIPIQEPANASDEAPLAQVPPKSTKKAPWTVSDEPDSAQHLSKPLLNVKELIPNQAKQASEEPQVMLSQDPVDRSVTGRPVDAEEIAEDVQAGPKRHRRHFSPFRRTTKDKSSRDNSPNPLPASAAADCYSPSHMGETGVRVASQGTQNTGSDMSGRPFARAASSRNITQATDGPNDEPETKEWSPVADRGRAHNALHPHHEYKKTVFVPVGTSRLHLVEMPGLLMKPIYWSPINDQSNVIRATWFFKESMLPIPAEVSNRLEAGYEDMKPYTNQYQDELSACIENGAAAELKVVHKLWPNKPKASRPSTATAPKNEEDARQPPGPGVQENVAADARETRSDMLFETCSVIYLNKEDAQILKPNQLPSESRNRKPLSSIRKGRAIGVQVVRGFDREAWLKLHPDPKMDQRAAQAAIGAYMSQSGDATTRNRRMSCATCDKRAPSVSDLVLVIHGIGQKLSERVDSFHFTHAINSLRREFNVELASEAVKGNLRQNTGMMVLPVNWRLTLSFDDDQKVARTTAENKYQLSDITPDTLPAVRSLISDVMLDIPYYLSHHKEKMTSAVVKEANRVYRLWCRNNPGFQEYGRVHLIAHSLGSAMATDILSQQPTMVPRTIDVNGEIVSHRMFEFNTTNLFCCGSPSGFFLLLNNANLIPRKGRDKPGMEGEDKAHGIAGEAGTYGCLAVDNIYNICHRNDPIAYQQNACVDSSYAASLIPATIPSASLGILARVSNTLRWNSPSTSAAYDTVAGPQRPAMHTMPSTVEMETHNFTQEEIAEKRMYLLNDNGQIDYFLNSGGGPLEIQYLNMLSAHSSYWVLQDFVRFLVVEIGRVPGRNGTLPALRARKKREYKRGAIA